MDERVTVRPATPDDADASLDVLFAVAEEPGSLIGVITPDKQAQQRAALPEWIRENRHRILVADTEGGIVGSLWVLVNDGVGEIKLNVARDWRSRGVGAGMIAAAEDWAREKGLRKLWLAVYGDNVRAIALYERLGYEHEGRQRAHQRFPNGEIQDVVLMGKLLLAPG